MTFARELQRLQEEEAATYQQLQDPSVYRQDSNGVSDPDSSVYIDLNLAHCVFT